MYICIYIYIYIYTHIHIYIRVSGQATERPSGWSWDRGAYGSSEQATVTKYRT